MLTLLSLQFLLIHDPYLLDTVHFFFFFDLPPIWSSEYLYFDALCFQSQINMLMFKVVPHDRSKRVLVKVSTLREITENVRTRLNLVDGNYRV